MLEAVAAQLQKKNKGVTSIDKRHFLKHIWKGWNYYGFEIWLVD